MAILWRLYILEHSHVQCAGLESIPAVLVRSVLSSTVYGSQYTKYNTHSDYGIYNSSDDHRIARKKYVQYVGEESVGKRQRTTHILLT